MKKVCILLFLCLPFVVVNAAEGEKPRTHVTIQQDKFFINGTMTYDQAKRDTVKGLLLNSRMVQGIFDDENPETRSLWKYPDTGEWSPQRNTDEFVAAMKDWCDHGLLAFTLNLQGGSPQGYSNQQPWINSAFDQEGNLKAVFFERLEKILREADRLGMIVILGLFYFGQDEFLKDENAIRNAVDKTLDWLHERKFRNILIEVNNECDIRYDHDILKPQRVHELILRIKNDVRDGFRYPVSTSYGGGTIPGDNVLQVSDFVLLHGNGVSDPKRITAMVETVRTKLGDRKIPILFNEDDHFDFDKEENNMDAALRAGASWGYFDYRMKDEGFQEGFQSVPVDWNIGSERKQAFFQRVKQWVEE